MRWLLLLAVIGVFLVKNVVSSKNHGYPSRLDWLFGSNNKQDENKEENKPTICQSQECKKIAQIFSESMDKTVDPCDDFYEYACGKWPEHNPIPEGMDSWSMFANAQVNVAKQIKEIFDEGPKNNDLLAVKLAKKWYAVCMNTNAMEEQGLEPIVFTLSRIGGWPLIMEPDEWNEEEYSWQKVDDQYVRLTGRNAFHDVRVELHYDDSSNETQNVVHIDTPHLPPGSYRLWGGIDSGEEEDESDEDLSDEEKQSDEQKDSQEPGSEDKSDNKDSPGNEDDNNDDDDDDNNDDDDDDNNNDDDEDDNNEEDKNDDNDTNEQNDDHNAKKKVGIKKAGKIVKNKKLNHNKKKSSTHLKKHENHKTKKDRIKRWTIPTNIREKLRAWKNERNNVKQERIERLKKTLEATTPQSSTKETIDEDDELKKYANYISKVARAMAQARGVEVSEEYMDKDIQDMIEFHMKLAEITMESSDDERMTLNNFQEWYDEKNPKTSNCKIDWIYKVGELFDEAHVPIDGDLDLEIDKPDYFDNLMALLDKTSSRTIVNYIHWNFLSRIIRTTTKEMRKLYEVWETKESDAETILGIPERSFKCAFEIKMSDILAYEYVRNHFTDDVMATASDMIDDIQKEVEYQIKESDWMDENTKEFVLSKLVNMDKFVGYPDWYRNNTIVKRYYQGLVLSHSYYENSLSYDRYSKWKSLRKLMQEDEDEVDEMINPVIVNAYFDPYDNSIALSAADFQSPLFAYGRPQVINYGIVGSIMGHEVNHGFDDSGHLYDQRGKVVEWLSAMAEAYGKRAECFVEQFNNYPIDKKSKYKIKNYGNQTAGENIADTMGLEAAFRAYRRRERECGKSDTVLPDHEDLTNDQLFFLSFASLWCEAAETSNVTINNAKNDPHSIGRLRIIGSVSNSDDFAEAYNCPVGSTMNPEKKCHIWK